MMEFRELRTFQVVANLLSFNKAAHVLNYAQSTVSSQIQSLENSLEEVWFVRSGNKISLTASGVKLLMQTNVRLKKTIEVNSPEAVKKLLMLGCDGFALLPGIAVESEVAEGFLKRYKWKGPALNAKLYMIWKMDKYQTEATKAFVDAVRVSFGKRIG